MTTTQKPPREFVSLGGSIKCVLDDFSTFQDDSSVRFSTPFSFRLPGCLYRLGK